MKGLVAAAQCRPPRRSSSPSSASPSASPSASSSLSSSLASSLSSSPTTSSWWSPSPGTSIAHTQTRRSASGMAVQTPRQRDTARHFLADDVGGDLPRHGGACYYRRPLTDDYWPKGSVNGSLHGPRAYCQDVDVWKKAPTLIGSTQFEPRPDVRNIMITGGAGFIASWVVRHLTLTYPQAYNIVSFDKLDYCSALNNTRVLNGRRNFTFHHGDLTNPLEVLDCMERYDIDTVMHFAAQSHVDLSFGNSYSFTHVNVYGTHVLLESARKVGVRRFIHVSTDEVYGEVQNGEDEAVETSILAPTNPYAASKAAAEMLVHSYHKSFKLPIITVRSNNVYGPHQFPEKIISKFMCLLHRGQPVVLHGDGSPTRRYLYAADAADAFDTILHKGEVGQVYNVGSVDEISNLELSGKILSAMDIACETPEQFRKWVKYTHDRPFNDCRYAIDGSKLQKLGWTQKTTFEQGLRETADWYRRFGEEWWGDISHALTPFPVVTEGEMKPDVGHCIKDSPHQSKQGCLADGEEAAGTLGTLEHF